MKRLLQHNNCSGCGPYRMGLAAFVIVMLATTASRAQSTDESTSHSTAQARAQSTEGDSVVTAPIDVHIEPVSEGPEDLTSERSRHANSDRALEEPAFVTVVRVQDKAGEVTSIADVLSRSLGINVRSLGGLGGYSAISVRGHSAGQTAVFVDGVPLSRLATAATDIGRFELDTFSKLEVFRGGVPAELGGAALGGVLNMLTRVGRPPDGRRLRFSVGTGSFGARHVRARWLDGRADGSLGYRVSLGYTGATGDYSYFNDNGTNLQPADDMIVERTNNGYDQVDAAARARWRRGDLAVDGGARTLWKSQGVPGSASVQSQNTSFESISQLFDGRVLDTSLLSRDDISGSVRGYVLVERQRYIDLDGEVGVGAQDQRYRSVSAGAVAKASISIGDHLASASADVGGDYFDQRDLVTNTRRQRGSRARGAMSLSDDWIVDTAERLVLQPSLRLDVLYTNPLGSSATSVFGEMATTAHTEVFPSPRLAARVRISDGVAMKSSAGYYFRAPTLLESYGDRGFILGNPDVRSETGSSVDLGIVVAPTRRLGIFDRVYFELVAFGSRSKDTILLMPTAGLAARAANLGDADIYGAEVGGSVRIASALTASANYTLIESRQFNTVPSYEGRRLPQRPRHQFYGRLDLAHRFAGHLVVLWSDATLTASNFLDAANFREVPVRRLFGAGVKFAPIPGVLVGIDLKNLSDERVESIELSPAPRPDLARVPRAISDFFGYPLPGRALYVTAEWSH